MKTFDAANNWLKGRVNVPTSMSSRELSLSPNFEPKVRAHAFFSAKVAEAHILEKLREVSDAYSSGKLGKSEARTRIKKFLYGKGYQPDDVAAGVKDPNRAITNLASTARIDLILYQNAAMANAVGQREVAMDPDILERWPNYTYIARPNARPSHGRFNGLTLAKTDPFWRTHTPPWEFYCKCRLEDSDGKANGSVIKTDAGWKINHNGQLIELPEVPESGYVFDVSEAFETCDMSRLKDIEPRRAVFDSLRQYTRKHDKVRFVCSPGSRAEAVIKTEPRGRSPHSRVDAYLKEQNDHLEEHGEYSDATLTIGQFSKGLADSLGMVETDKITLSRGSGGHGLLHMTKNHKKEILDGRFLQAIADTLWMKAARPVVTLTGKQMLCTITNHKTGAFMTLRRFEQEKEWRIVSAHYPGKTQIEKKEKLRK